MNPLLSRILHTSNTLPIGNTQQPGTRIDVRPSSAKYIHTHTSPALVLPSPCTPELRACHFKPRFEWLPIDRPGSESVHARRQSVFQGLGRCSWVSLEHPQRSLIHFLCPQPSSVHRGCPYGRVLSLRSQSIATRVSAAWYSMYSTELIGRGHVPRTTCTCTCMSAAQISAIHSPPSSTSSASASTSPFPIPDLRQHPDVPVFACACAFVCVT
ncbi:hypothetical protein C8Q74DRAFT_612446 [Fomes fomentarius]|nr:hypothetical protein C8Q74DRAFT_612446 [Fomes fomentarius]